MIIIYSGSAHVTGGDLEDSGSQAEVEAGGGGGLVYRGITIWGAGGGGIRRSTL